MKKFLSLALALCLALSAAACGSASSTPVSSAPVSSAPASSAPASQPAMGGEMTDRAGNSFTAPQTAGKIISMAPSITQTLMDLGCQDQIIAVDSNSVDDLGKEGITAFDMMAPDAEAMAALKPDLVLVSGISMWDGSEPFKPLQELGIAVAAIPTSQSIEDIYKDIQFIGDVVGKSSEAKALNEELKKELEKITALGASIPEEERKTVYFEIDPGYSFGSGVYLDEMIQMVGGKNALADQSSWLQVDPEQAAAANPDVIFTNVNYTETPAVDEILAREALSGVKAVKDKQVFYIDNDSSALPNENITKALWQMGQALYPDVFKQ